MAKKSELEIRTCAHLVAGGEIGVRSREGVEGTGANPPSAELLRGNAQEPADVRPYTD